MFQAQHSKMCPEGSPTRSRECTAGGRWEWGPTGSQNPRSPCPTEGKSEGRQSGTECSICKSIHIKWSLIPCMQKFMTGLIGLV